MEYAYRSHEAFIELDPGATGEWRLPPMTPGVITIKSTYAMPPGWVGTSERRLESPSPGRAFDANSVATIARSMALTGDNFEVNPSGPGTINLNQPTGPRRGIAGIGDFDIEDIDGGSWGPTMELDLELIRGGQTIATGNNTIFQQTPNSGDIWALRIKRKSDGSLERRRYKITAAYPSILPLEKRRIPIGFFKRGFEKNWNSDPLFSWIQMRDNVFSYKWQPLYAMMYEKPTDNVNVPLNVDPLKLPDIRSFKITLDAGIDPDPLPQLLIPGQARRDHFYFALRADLEFLGSNEVEIDVTGPNPSFPLPNPLWFEAKFFFRPSVGGTISFIPKVRSPLFDMLDRNISYPTLSGEIKTVNIKHEVVKAIEDHIYQVVLTSAGKIDGFLRPYLVGRYEILDIVGDLQADELVISYLGKQKPPQEPTAVSMMMADEASTGSAPIYLAWARLFNTPYELPLPYTGQGFDGLVRVSAPIDPGALNKINHIVVLMQENRSFDQVLGYLSRDGLLRRDQLDEIIQNGSLNGSEVRETPQADVNGLASNSSNRDTIRHPDEPGGHEYRSQRTTSTDWPFDLDNPSHGHDDVARQISDGMKGFIADYARKGMNQEQLQRIMHYYTDAELPAYGALAREFAICDAWFCSHIGGTLPNRFINLSGDFSEDVFGSPEEENPTLSFGFAPLTKPTFFDHLTKSGVEWRLFEHKYSMLRLVRNFTFDETNIVGFNNPINGFVATAVAGALPPVTFIEPDYIEKPNGNDDHAPADMKNGQRLVATIMDALLRSPQWEKTLFIITYDEHGGFYDHQEPSYETDGRPNPPLATGERRPGVRVPAFVISPYIEPMDGSKVNVSKTVFEHTSITASIIRRFCGPRPPEMSPRVAGAADLRGLLTRDTPRPRSDFDGLANEMRLIAAWPEFATEGNSLPAPLRRPKREDIEDDFAGLIAFSSSITGLGRA